MLTSTNVQILLERTWGVKMELPALTNQAHMSATAHRAFSACTAPRGVTTVGRHLRPSCADTATASPEWVAATTASATRAGLKGMEFHALKTWMSVQVVAQHVPGIHLYHALMCLGHFIADLAQQATLEMGFIVWTLMNVSKIMEDAVSNPMCNVSTQRVLDVVVNVQLATREMV
ncbi:uncharacterized protein LOC124711576 [Schistocerca piceifrons]|uniref:uncharacterized protein LOC124711576 n=1 Tax=Schistocerca piceifrons TaxID=274613 RepID=UPI001F5FA7EF|nr:uncharacterized protein LOC124711576 [Schistocerca piceifrons]